jgi:inner membrane protein
MDVGTHALASIALARISLPRAPLISWVFVVAAGTIADLDSLSALLSPAAYLSCHRTYSHSLVVSTALGLGLYVLFARLIDKSTETRASRFVLFATILLAGWLHLAMDACQYQGAELFWPFSGRRIAADWLAGVDPWILAVLVLAIAMPELLRLVSSEIGAKEKGPRGRTGAILGLLAVFFYIGARAVAHSNALAAMEARTYRGESPRRAAALPESVSPFAWHGIVETESALHLVPISVVPGASFDPERGVTLYKPEASPVLDGARNSKAARTFLSVARFPKATVEKTPDGSRVALRDVLYAAVGETRREIVAIVRVDANGKVAEDDLVWARDLHRR